MSLPDLIEILPSRPSPESKCLITVPGSKSITNRALVMAALVEGRTVIEGALWSEDTQVMVECLHRLGFAVDVAADPAEPANRTISVDGLGGRIPNAGTELVPLELFVGNAGTAARFLMAMVCLGGGAFRLAGVPRMHERPQGELIAALRCLGYRIDAEGGTLPVVVHGGGPRPGHCVVSAKASSQFASALILSASRGGWEVVVEGAADEDELPYVEMTRQMVQSFPRAGGRFVIEPDASSGSYFVGADAVYGDGTGRSGLVTVAHWPDSGWQADAAFPRYLPLPAEVSRARDLADSIMTAIVLAPFARHAVRFTELGRLRVQECERVEALRVQLGRCGAKVVEVGDSLEVQPSTLHGAEIETYGDHRMAMCFALVGLRVPGVRLRDPGCVRKTFPNFFAKLAAPAPLGLGVSVRDARTGRVLAGDELLAG